MTFGLAGGAAASGVLTGPAIVASLAGSCGHLGHFAPSSTLF